MASGLPYWIEEFGGNFTIWVKTSIPANGTKTIYITKEAGYSPDPFTIFEFFDHFDTADNWDDALARGIYSVNDSILKMTGDWGSCCSGACYYNGLSTKFNLTRPFTVDIVFQQNPYTPFTNCGRTGPSLEHLNQMAAIPSTSSGGDGLNFRAGSENTTTDNPFQTGWQRLSVDFMETAIRAKGSWMSGYATFTPSSTPPNDPAPLCIAGDTDDTTITDEVDYLLIRKFAQLAPTTTVTQLTSTIWKVEISNPNSTDLVDFQVPIPGNGIVSTTTESLNISDTIVKVLFATADGKLWRYDGTNWVYVDDKTTIDEATFDSNGMENPVVIDKATIQSLTPTPEIVAYAPGETPSVVTLNVKFVPYAKLIVPNQLKNITGYSEFTVTVDYNGNGLIKLLVTKDLDNYYTWDSGTSQWVLVKSGGLDYSSDSDITTVLDNGMTPATVNGLTWTEWQSIYPEGPTQIAFAIVIQYATSSNNLKSDYIRLAVKPASDIWTNDTNNHTIDQLEDAIVITFSDAGLFKINYLD